MSKRLLLFIVCVLLCNISKAQWPIYDGLPNDSVEITFDSLQIADLVTDSSGLWQIGNTNKAYFIQGGNPVRSIMTDTSNSYLINANAWFEIKFANHFFYNLIVDFSHKYQTDSFHDGCIVEFSTDDGATWENVKGDCNGDMNPNYNKVLTSNLYAQSDTLITGEMAFSGNSQGWIHSRLQFFSGFPFKSTDSTIWCHMDSDTIRVRFRFVSDSVADTLDGWIIDSIKIEKDYYETSVKNVSQDQKLNTYPNPSFDGNFYFPEIGNKEDYKIDILTSYGQKVYTGTYQHSIDLSKYAKGLYFYKVVGENEQYSGQLISQ